MPLGTSLASDIQAVFAGYPASAHISAAGVAAAYHSYVSGALFGASVPVLTTAMRDAFAATLEAALTVPGLPATAAAAYPSALVAYWTSVPCAGGSGAGTTNGCSGAAGALAGITADFANLANTASSSASTLAAALATATATVNATLTLPPGGPIVWPIS